MNDIDSAGVYFLSVEEFESRTPPPLPYGELASKVEDRTSGGTKKNDAEDQPNVDATKSAITRPSSSPQSS
jgi:hypothetical protein